MRKRRFAIAAVVTAVALSLSGCVKVVSSVVLHDDNTVSGEYIFALEKQYAEGMSDADIMSMLGGDAATDQMVNAHTEKYDDGTFIGSKIVFEDEPLANITEDGSITREGDTFRFQGTATDPAELEGITDTAVMTMSITFPGAVTDTNGKVSGTTVTWDMKTFTDAPYAVGGAIGTGDDAGVPGSSSSGGVPPWLWIVLGVVVVGGVIVLVTRGKGSAAPAEDAPKPATSEAKPAKSDAKPAAKAAPKKPGAKK